MTVEATEKVIADLAAEIDRVCARCCQFEANPAALPC